MMYSRLYKSLSIQGCIYDLQFGFCENHSTNHVIVSLSESIRQAPDGNNFACGVFIDLQKAFEEIMELREKQTNGSAIYSGIYLIEVNLSRLMALTRELKLLVLLSRDALS